MIKCIILIILACIAIRVLVFLILLFVTKYRIDSLLDEIVDSLPDERSVKNFIIELNKVDCVFYEDEVFDNFVRVFSDVNPNNWISPYFLAVIENRLPNKKDT